MHGIVHRFLEEPGFSSIVLAYGQTLGVVDLSGPNGTTVEFDLYFRETKVATSWKSNTYKTLK